MRGIFSCSSRSTGTSYLAILTTVLLGSQVAHASIELNLDDDQSIKDAAKEVAAGMFEYYTGDEPGDVPGNLPDPYFWWEAGAMFGSLIDYWYYTGDDQYNDSIEKAMLHQTGPDNNYMPSNQSRSLGNDDQGFWGMAALTAAENKFPNPPDDQPQWLALAQAVFNSQAGLWDEDTCGGGLRWQIFTFNNGYNYKNTISNGVFFNLAARLASYTANDTYAEWAERAYDWMTSVNLISPTYQAFDGTDSTTNCSGLNHIQWSYNNGVLLSGAAHMWNFTDRDPKWEERVNGLLRGQGVFFTDEPKNVMTEVACEDNGRCNVDQRSFKAYLSRFMADTAKVAPFTYDRVMAKLRASATYAALQCNGPDNACGLRWIDGAEYDGSTGVGEQMAALEVIQSNLIDKVSGPANSDSGISKGDPSGGSDSPDPFSFSEIKTSDRVGAGFVTTIILVLVMGAAVWLVI